MAIKIKDNKACFCTPCYFKRYGIYLIIIAPFFALLYKPISIKAQNISHRYTSHRQENGILYHVFPIKKFNSVDSGNDFLFDITYSTEKDSAIINFSFFSKQALSVSGLTLDKTNSPAKKIYIDIKKNKWIYRYSSVFSFEDIKLFFSKKEKPIIMLITEKESIEIATSAKNWKKISAALSKIFIIIDQNKK